MVSRRYDPAPVPVRFWYSSAFVPEYRLMNSFASLPAVVVVSRPSSLADVIKRNVTRKFSGALRTGRIIARTRHRARFTVCTIHFARFPADRSLLRSWRSCPRARNYRPSFMALATGRTPMEFQITSFSSSRAFAFETISRQSSSVRWWNSKLQAFPLRI